MVLQAIASTDSASSGPDRRKPVVLPHSFQSSVCSAETSTSGVNGGSDDILNALDADSGDTPCSILPCIADALQQSMERGEFRTCGALNLTSAASTSGVTVFHGQNAPPISLTAYIERLSKYSRCSPVCFVMAFVYMDVLAQKNPLLQPCGLSVHRLLLAGVMVAAKFMDDGFFNNAFYAKIGGVTTLELNRLELEMLRLLDFRLFVQPELLWCYTQHLKAGDLLIGTNLAHHGRIAAPLSCAA